MQDGSTTAHPPMLAHGNSTGRVVAITKAERTPNVHNRRSGREKCMFRNASPTMQGAPAVHGQGAQDSEPWALQG